MSEQTKEALKQDAVKQEGDFSLKAKKTKPKQLGKKVDKITKVDLTKPEATGEIVPDVVKVEVPKEALKQEEDAIQIGETTELAV